MDKKMHRRFKKILGIGFGAVVGILVIYIMANGLGLVNGLDFGAGAYYYADIPEFAKYVNADHYASHVPMVVHIVLFLIWGTLMYRLWTWLDKVTSKKK